MGGIQYTTGGIVFPNRPHNCPHCGARLEVIKREEKLNWRSEKAREITRASGSRSMFVGNNLYIWRELWCPNCKKSYSIRDIREADDLRDTRAVLDIDRNRPIRMKWRPFFYSFAVPTKMTEDQTCERLKQLSGRSWKNGYCFQPVDRSFRSLLLKKNLLQKSGRSLPLAVRSQIGTGSDGTANVGFFLSVRQDSLRLLPMLVRFAGAVSLIYAVMFFLHDGVGPLRAFLPGAIFLTVMSAASVGFHLTARSLKKNICEALGLSLS